MIRLFSTTPTANPARSYSPSAYIPGISAVSPPISAQPASRSRARCPDDVGRDRNVELAAGEIVEEEERLGALRENVVDAHCHEVDAHRVVARELESELQLGADAIGARYEHRVAVFAWNPGERAEAADAGEHLRAQRPFREGLDRLDQRVARVDVHPCVAVGDRLLAGQGRLQIKWRDSPRILVEMPSARLQALD
jgi:hypothetical protein